MASGTLLKEVCQPPSASVVAQMKNIAKFVILRKKILLKRIVPQKRLSCSPIPYITNPMIIETTPTSINANVTVLYLLGNSKRYLIEEAILSFLFLDQLLFNSIYLPVESSFAAPVVAVVVAPAGAAAAGTCFDLI